MMGPAVGDQDSLFYELILKIEYQPTIFCAGLMRFST